MRLDPPGSRPPRAHGSHCRLAPSCWNTAFGLTADTSIHTIWFAAWIGSLVEPYPFGLLTMIVSLEAIFLSTFVMISQNRADEKRQVLADHQWWTSSRRSSRTWSCCTSPTRSWSSPRPSTP